MWQRFSNQAREAIFYAQEEAQNFGHSNVSTEHILLGLVREETTVASVLLMKMGISLTDLRAEVMKQIVGSDDTRSAPEMTLTPRAKRVIDLAYHEARGLDRTYIGGEHLLLGLIAERDGVAGRALAAVGADLARARQEAATFDPPPDRNPPQTPSKTQSSWQRCSRDARNAIDVAKEEAVKRTHPFVSTEHLLLGIISDPESPASLILTKLEVSLEEIRGEVDRQMVAEGVPSSTGETNLSPRGKRAIDLAYQEAHNAGRNYVGTEHLLLGLILQGDGVASKVLADLGVDVDRARHEAAQFNLETPSAPGQPEHQPQSRNQPMWQRFTERARKVVFYAQEEAQKFGEGYVSTEHMLLGLCRESDSVAARVLEQLGISLNRIRVEVEKQLPVGDARPSQDMTLTPRCKRVIDLAYDEARNLNNNYIGTEHLLLGLIREGDGLAGRVLAKLGADLERARRIVMVLQDQEGRQVVGSPEPAPSKPTRTYAWSDYDETAQRAILLADEMAKAQGESQVWPYHLILALLSEMDSGAARVLQKAGIDPAHLLEAVERHRTWAEGAPPVNLSPNSRLAIDATCAEANSLDGDTIGTEHLLLGLAYGNVKGVGAILSDLGVTPAKLRRAVVEMKE